MNELERLKAELERVQKQSAAVRCEMGALSEELMHREDCLGVFLRERDQARQQAAALRGALVRLCNSWAEGTERENYEAMKEAKAALEQARTLGL